MFAFGEERLAPVNGIEIAYQEMGDPDGTPLVLIMGLGTQMIGWNEDLCSLFAERGYRVVRFDNRDIGHSTSLDAAGVPGRVDVLLGRRDSAAYFLTDMADDTLALTDHLGIESAHFVGASMGGMIAQTIAICRPERMRSMTSMLSTTGSRWVGTPTWRAMAVLLGSPPRGRDAFIERAVVAFRTIGSPGYPFDEERVRQTAGLAYDRGRSPDGVARQMHAIVASGDRTAELRRLRVPTTVIHGAEDPLVRPSGGRATAAAIPGARLRMIDGMGHDLPREVWPIVVEEITSLAERAEGLERTARVPV